MACFLVFLFADFVFLCTFAIDHCKETTKGDITKFDSIVAKIIEDVGQQLKKLHENGWGHMDIKLDNIMYWKSMKKFVLIDFDNVARLDELKQPGATSNGKKEFRHPALHNKFTQTFDCDDETKKDYQHGFQTCWQQCDYFSLWTSINAKRQALFPQLLIQQNMNDNSQTTGAGLAWMYQMQCPPYWQFEDWLHRYRNMKEECQAL